MNLEYIQTFIWATVSGENAGEQSAGAQCILFTGSQDRSRVLCGWVCILDACYVRYNCMYVPGSHVMDGLSGDTLHSLTTPNWHHHLHWSFS